MVLELHENASPTPWLQGAPPDSAALSIERLPGLVYALEQFSLGLANALDPFCRASSGGEVDELRSTNLFQFLSENEGLTVAVLNCAAFDARMLLIFDDRIADTVVTAVFRSGGDGLAPPRSRRSRSAVESALISEFSRYLTQALVKSFEQTGGLALEFEHLETLADVYALGRRDMPAIAAQVTIAAASGSMPLTLLFPQSLLLPIRKSLAYDPGNTAPAGDPRWIRDLEARVNKTPVAVTAILDEFDLTLGDVAEFTVGQVLTLHGAGVGRVRLECAGRQIFWCKLGEGDGRYALEVEEPITQEEDDQSTPTH